MSKIEWTDETWNPLAGCTRVSAGCQHCYAERMARRQIGMGNKNYAGTVDKHGRWTGQINLIPDALEKPFHWRKPRRIFVNSMSDLFHKNVSDEYIRRVFSVMDDWKCRRHTFQILTKRPERAAQYCRDNQSEPLPNVHLGVSVENQETADERIPWLLKTPAAVRWISYEPALGPVDFLMTAFDGAESFSAMGGLDGIVMGGESGPGARPMHPDWARSVRDQCQEAEVPFFFKQWGAWVPACALKPDSKISRWGHLEGHLGVYRVGKKAAGRILDGKVWDELPGQPVA